MNIKIMYHSTTGNTKKLADAIANSLDLTAEPLSKEAIALTEPVDLLFLGDGLYAGKPNKRTQAFIETLDPKLVRNVAVFATYGGQDKIGADLKQLLQSRKLKVVGEPFVCKGQSWLFVNRGRPNDADLYDVSEFARSVVTSVK